MSDRISRLEARLGEIDRALADVSHRVGELEARAVTVPDVPPEGAPALAGVSLPPAIAARTDLSTIATLAGRTFVVLGGAFLLRALTDSGRLPGQGGVVLGLVYAAVWFAAADRAGLSHPLSGLFHGVTAVIISLPLLWEASTHFHLLSPAPSAVLLAVVTAVALGVAWHRRMQGLAGVAIIGAIAVAGALTVATARPLPFAAGLLALGGSTSWLSDSRGWTWLRWPPAFAADAMALGLLARADVMPPVDPHGAVIILLLALFASYLGPVTWHALVLDRRVQASEVFQAVCAVGLGLFGALFVARAGPGPAQPLLSGFSVAAAAGAYLAAFGMLGPRSGNWANVVFFTTLGLVLLLAGGAAIVTGPARVAWCGGLAVAAAAIGARRSEPQLSAHAAVLCLVMATVSGLIAWTGRVWWAPGPWLTPGVGHVATAFVAAACVVMPAVVAASAAPVPASRLANGSRVVEAGMVSAWAGGVAVWCLASALFAAPLDAGMLATLRTAILAATALGAAALSRRTAAMPFGYLVYPLLGAGGLKLVFDDFRYSAAATLFVALAVYGLALIAAPRLGRRA